MKVGIRFGDQPAGGGATMQAQILDALGRQVSGTRHQIVALLMEGRSGLRERASRAGLQFDVVPGGGVLRRAISELAEIVPTFSNVLRAPDPIERYAKANGLEMIWFASPMAGPSIDIPYIATVWDLQHRVQPWFPEVSAGGEWARRERHYTSFLRRAFAVIAANEAGRNEVAALYAIPRERIRVLSHPAPIAVQPAKGESPFPQPFILYPAQFWPHKNHANLLHALRVLHDGGLAMHVVLTGTDRGNKAHVEHMARELGLAEYVHMPGNVSDGDLARLYLHAVALSYVSFFGPENLPPLEAFAAGCPVIASRVDGAEEQLGDAAILVDPRDPARIAEAIGSLARDSGRRETLIARGRERAHRCTPDDFVRGVFALFDEFEPVRRCWP
jgi:glycosyltransferase involved in cell wall biosynthesis